MNMLAKYCAVTQYECFIIIMLQSIDGDADNVSRSVNMGKEKGRIIDSDQCPFKRTHWKIYLPLLR